MGFVTKCDILGVQRRGRISKCAMQRLPVKRERYEERRPARTAARSEGPGESGLQELSQLRRRLKLWNWLQFLATARGGA
jgi:hypothetical protein